MLSTPTLTVAIGDIGVLFVPRLSISLDILLRNWLLCMRVVVASYIADRVSFLSAVSPTIFSGYFCLLATSTMTVTIRYIVQVNSSNLLAVLRDVCASLELLH